MQRPKNFKTISRTIYLLALMFSLPFVLHKFSDTLEKQRGIASDSQAIQADDYTDLSEVEDEDFLKVFKYQVLNAAHLEKENGRSGIRLNAVYVRNDHDARVFLCQKYNKIEMTYSAEGMAISGDIPYLKVTGECSISDDFKSIEPFYIPTRISDTHQENYRIQLSHPDEDLPQDWVWSGVSFIDSESGESIDITAYEIISVLGTDIFIKFDPTE